MRLEPIEKPPGLLMRIAYWMSRRQLGVVMSPLKVIYARVPELSMFAYRAQQIVEKKLSLDPELRLLIVTHSALLNGCSFCADLHHAQAVQARLGLRRFQTLLDFRSSEHFSEREKAVLAYVAEVTRTRDASDATFEALRKHCSDREIVEITWLNALGNYTNLMAVPLRIESDGIAELALQRTS